ncbi:MAG: molybdopterin-binding protein [Nitrospirota bacterium]|nr:molybdopterin-binding protein [Nitrospirota bacterium]
MCNGNHAEEESPLSGTAIPVTEAVGTVLAHDITEIRPGEFKGRAYKKGHVVGEEDVCRLQRLGKEHLYVLQVADEEMHEDDAANVLAAALMGEGVRIQGEPKEGKINIVADRDGLLRIDREALLGFNMLGEVMCATLHDNTVVRKGRVIAGTRAIPLVIRRSVVEQAVNIAERGLRNGELKSERMKTGVIEVKELRKPRAGVVITGNEVYHGRIKDAFAPVIAEKIGDMGGELAGVYYAPDDRSFIADRLRDLLNAGADLLIATGGMSVDPDDVTRQAIRDLGVSDITYGSAVLPGAMVLVGYIETRDKRQETGMPGSELITCRSSLVPILGIPACGMYHKITIIDLILPRILAGERIGRKELAALGHGGLCLHCDLCRYPVCPFGKLG